MFFEDEKRSSHYNQLPVQETEDLLFHPSRFDKGQRSSIFSQWRNFITHAIEGLNITKRAAHGQISGSSDDLGAYDDATGYIPFWENETRTLASLARGFNSLATDQPSRPKDATRAIKFATRVTDHEASRPIR